MFKTENTPFENLVLIYKEEVDPQQIEKEAFLNSKVHYSKSAYSDYFYEVMTNTFIDVLQELFGAYSSKLEKLDRRFFIARLEPDVGFKYTQAMGAKATFVFTSESHASIAVDYFIASHREFQAKQAHNALSKTNYPVCHYYDVTAKGIVVEIDTVIDPFNRLQQHYRFTPEQQTELREFLKSKF